VLLTQAIFGKILAIILRQYKVRFQIACANYRRLQNLCHCQDIISCPGKVIVSNLIIVTFCLCLLSAATDVKENKENDKKTDQLKDPPLEPETLSRVGVVI